jgi:hypothetical protein
LHLNIGKEQRMSTFTTYIGARDGVYRLQGDQLDSLGLTDQRVWAIHGWHNESGAVTLLAGTYGDGIFRSDDGGKSWSPSSDGLTATALRTIGPDPTQPEALLCGTEPGRAFRSHDGGHSWSELTGIHDLEAYEEWYLPYSPRAGAIRNFYSPPGSGSRLLASVEVGGLLDSPDAGETWSYIEVPPDHDIHHIGGHPDDPNLLYASLGYAGLKNEKRDEHSPKLGGVGRSRDGGKSWTKLLTDYTRATIIPPTHTNLILAGPAPFVGRMGRIDVSSDGGDTWQSASNGIETPMVDMVELFQLAPDNSIWAVTSGGNLLWSEPGDWHWRSALPNGKRLDVQSAVFLSNG